ncbi:hypothetical protein KSZ_35460 [Dictyobacter formicarum]|uniref:Uncharacterized protein n=1 Tax=Dictyobacter formicarum TaxID=2778368 RepID=A0ABQ3VHL5_9CHLR|nr:hypothetical protein KSZ_35460 [Dictyobacter formicarum]
MFHFQVEQDTVAVLPEAKLVSTLELLGYSTRNTYGAPGGARGRLSPCRGCGGGPHDLLSLFCEPPQAATRVAAATTVHLNN